VAERPRACHICDPDSGKFRGFPGAIVAEKPRIRYIFVNTSPDQRAEAGVSNRPREPCVLPSRSTRAFELKNPGIGEGFGHLERFPVLEAARSGIRRLRVRCRGPCARFGGRSRSERAPRRVPYCLSGVARRNHAQPTGGMSGLRVKNTRRRPCEERGCAPVTAKVPGVTSLTHRPGQSLEGVSDSPPSQLDPR
jgi:hypothetical protein